MVKIAAVVDSACLIGLERIGRLDLLIKAKQEGVIATVRPLLDALDANHFRISDALRAEALKLAGE